jgi:glycosyltransferase involved in cell wall biosynthesis
LVVGLWHTYHKPPYGGGNQFMLALHKELARLGIEVMENQILDKINFYLLNSIHFDIDTFTKLKKKRDLRIVHRIDGPIYLIRGYDREKDELCYKLNSAFASATVLQSNYVHRKIVEFGYQPVKPVIIHNAVDPDIFNRNGKLPFDRHRKIRLISTSWSGNPRKGGPIYRWIEEHLDWNSFEYTFVGNVSEPLQKIRQIPPVASEQLAEILKQHDIYITASENDPCSNALLEALTCGLPALYLNSGGHPELVGMGGLPFEGVDEIPIRIEALVDNYESHQNLIVVPTIKQVAEKYLSVMKNATE